MEPLALEGSMPSIGPWVGVVWLGSPDLHPHAMLPPPPPTVQGGNALVYNITADDYDDPWFTITTTSQSNASIALYCSNAGAATTPSATAAQFSSSAWGTCPGVGRP